MRYLLPFILAGVAILVYFSVIGPLYDGVKTKRLKVAELDKTLEESKQLLELRDALLQRYNSVSEETLKRMETLIPEGSDNSLRLILEIEEIAKKNNMDFADVSVEGAPRSSQGAGIGPDGKEFEEVSLIFSIEGSYESFRQFFIDLEKNLRLVDVKELSFAVGETLFGDKNQYEVTVQTYWFK